MSTFRKIEVESRDGDIGKLSRYTKHRDGESYTEKFFKKETEKKKQTSKIEGVSHDGNEWKITGLGDETTDADYGEYSVDNNIFDDFKFMTADGKKIGGYQGGGGYELTFARLVILALVLIIIWFVYEFYEVRKSILISNDEKILWNESLPTPTEFKELDKTDMCSIVKIARNNMLRTVGLL